MQRGHPCAGFAVARAGIPGGVLARDSRPAASSAADGRACDNARTRGDADRSSGPADRRLGDEEEIVITGAKPRGSVVGDIPPENTLDARDVRATGATNITELLDSIAPQIGSARGRGGEAPVLLLNGNRISGFRELRDIPTEAIVRVEIMPEEVALKYGYRADQKVVNIVLRERFRSTTAQVGAGPRPTAATPTAMPTSPGLSSSAADGPRSTCTPKATAC